MFEFLKKALSPEIKQKHFVNNSSFSFVGNKLLSCGNIVLNQNDKYKFLKINSDVSRCNDYISKKVGLGGIEIVDMEGEVIQEQENKKIYDYVERLFTLQTFNFWKKQLLTNTNISGENFIQPVYNGFAKIQRFEPIDSRAIIDRQIDSSNGEITSFTIMSLTTGQTKSLSRDDIGFYIYQEDPIMKDYGYGVIDGIIFDILADREAGKTNYYTFKNNGIPGAIFTLDESITDKDQIKQAGDELVKKFGGSENANKISASPYIKDVKVLNISNKDLEYIGGRRYSSGKIASAFGLHPKLIGYDGTTGSYSEIKEIRKEAHETTIKGFEVYVENIMNTLIDKFGKELEIDLSPYNLKLRSQSFDDQNIILENQRKDYELGLLTPNQIFNLRGLPEITDEFGESRYIKTNLIKVGAIKEPKEPINI